MNKFKVGDSVALARLDPPRGIDSGYCCTPNISFELKRIGLRGQVERVLSDQATHYARECYFVKFDGQAGSWWSHELELRRAYKPGTKLFDGRRVH